LWAPPFAAISAGAAEWHLTQSAPDRIGLSAANAKAPNAPVSITETKTALIVVTRFFIISPLLEIYL
jgi:hypothetical protein